MIVVSESSTTTKKNKKKTLGIYVGRIESTSQCVCVCVCACSHGKISMDKDNRPKQGVEIHRNYWKIIWGAKGLTKRSQGIYHSLYLPLPLLHKYLTNSHKYAWTSMYTTPPFIRATFFIFFISGLIPRLMNFNRSQSEHLSSVFLSPKVMDLNHLRVLTQLCIRRAKEVRMK